MIRHDCEGMQSVMVEHARVVVNRFGYHFSECGLAQVERAPASFVQQTVQCDEGLSRGEIAGSEDSVDGKTIVKPPG